MRCAKKRCPTVTQGQGTQGSPERWDGNNRVLAQLPVSHEDKTLVCVKH